MFLPFVLFILAYFFDGLMLFISYVSSSGAFPTPLTPEQEAKLLAEMEKGSKEARNVLVEHNLRLVAHIVKKFDNTKEDIDDLISIGTIGLIKAVNTYKKNKNTRLATYAARCIENEILMHLRASKKTRGESLLFDTIGSDKEGNEISLIDILESEINIEENIEQKVEKEAVFNRIKHLSSRERRVLVLRYGLQGGLRQTQREISKLLGISRSYVSRIEKRAISKLQETMAADGFR